MKKFLDNLRQAGLLLEFTAEEWEAYANKYFGPDSPLPKAFGPPRADQKDLRWKDPHKLDHRDTEPDV